MAYRAAPCLNPACRQMNVRDAAEPEPERCPKCGGELLLVARRVAAEHTPLPDQEAPRP